MGGGPFDAEASAHRGGQVDAEYVYLVCILGPNGCMVWSPAGP
jgi:hypothetical protein